MGRRIKDFEYTASAFSPDDYIAIDGETQGTRNMQYSTLVAEMSAAIGGGGTTEVIGDKCIYVDPENGLDTNSGLTEAKPVATVAQAYTLMESNNVDTFCVIGTEPNDPLANPIVVEIPAVPNTLQIDTLNIISKVSTSLKFLWVTFNQGSLNKTTNIVAKCPFVKIGYDASKNVNLTVNADGDVEIHNYTESDQTITDTLEVIAKGTVYLNCEPNEYSDSGDYPLWKDSNVYVNSININANDIHTWGRLNNGCHINLIATDTVYNHFELTYEDSQAIGESDSNWANVTQNYYLEAGNSVCQLEDVVANTFIVKSKYYGYRNGSSLVTGSLTVKSKVDIRTTNDTYIGFIEIGGVTINERGRVYIAGGFEQCVSDKALFDPQGKSLNNPILQINGIISHYGITASRNLHEYAPVVFIDWKGLIEHNGETIHAQQYKEKSLGYTTTSVLSGLYISGLDYFHNIDGVDTPIYHNYPVEIYSEGTLRNLKIYTGIDDASQKWIPVHIKCKNLVTDGVAGVGGIEICSHDIVIDVEDSIISSSQSTYFLPKPGNYYETDNGYVAQYIDTDTDTESSVIVRAKRNITFIPPTLDENYTCNQVFTVQAGEEFKLRNFGNFGTRICAKTINIKARKLSGSFDNFCAEFHVDVDVFETLGSYFKVYGYLGANDKWAHLGTTQSTFNAKTVIMLNDTTEAEPKPIAGIFDFGMISSNPTEVRNLDIHIDTIVCSFNWSSGIYCPLLRQFFDYKGEISGEIGCIVNTYGNKIHKVSRWQRDLTFVAPQPVDTAEGAINTWDLSARVSLHFAERSTPFDIYIDPNQGDDRYDGLTASTPIRTNIGLYRTLKANFPLSIDNSNHKISVYQPITLHIMSGYNDTNNNNRNYRYQGVGTLQFYVRNIDSDVLAKDVYYDMYFAFIEMLPEEPNLSIELRYLNAGVVNIHGFRDVVIKGLGGQTYTGTCEIHAGQLIEIDNSDVSIGGNYYYYNTRPFGYTFLHSGKDLNLKGIFSNIAAISEGRLTLKDTYGGEFSTDDNCCLYGSCILKSAEMELGDFNNAVNNAIGFCGYTVIESTKNINANLDTLKGEVQISAAQRFSGFVGTRYMLNCKLHIRAFDIEFQKNQSIPASFSGTMYQNSFYGATIVLNAEKYIQIVENTNIYNSDITFRAKNLVAYNNSQLNLYQGHSSQSIIDCADISVPITYRFGTLTIKSDRMRSSIYRMSNGPTAEYSGYTENLYLDIKEFDNSILLPCVQSTPNGYANIYANIGTTYTNLLMWSTDPTGITATVNYVFNVTVDHSRMSDKTRAISSFGDVLPDNATGEILILNRDITTEIPQPQVVNKTAVIPSGSTVAGVELENDNYNVIATIPAEATELDVNFPESTNKVQESGFQFDVEANSQLALIKAFITGRRLPVKAPSTFTDGKIYQGSSVNGIVVVAEFEPFNIVISSIQTDNPTSSSVDIILSGTNVEDNLEYDLVLISENGERTVHTTGSTYTLTGADFSFYDSAADLAATVIIGGVNYGSYALKGYPPIFDGRLYKFVKIGDQTWLAENLDLKYSGLQLNNTTWDYSNKQADYYNFDEELGKKYGLLYNFKAIEYLNNNRSTLTKGWKVPTKSDYETLISFAGGTDTAGSKLRAVGEWNNQSTSDTNSLKFSALPGGEGYNDGNSNASFENMGLSGYFNTITPYSSNSQYQNEAIWITNSPVIYFQPGKNYPFSVRLIRETVTVSITNNTSGLVTTSSTHTLPSGDVTIPLTFNDGSDPSCVSSSRGTVTSAGVVITGVTSNTSITLTRAKAKVNVVNGFSDGIDSISPTSQYAAPGADATFTITYKSGYSASNVMTNAGTISGSTLTVPVPSGSTSTITVTLSEKTTSVEIGGRSYKTTMIGDQEWMAENLDWQFSGLTMSTSANPIAPSTDTGTDPIGWYYNNDSSYATKCGMIYNYYAAMRAAELVGDGWEVPDGYNVGRLQRTLSNKYSTGSGSPNYQPSLKAIDNSVDGNWPTGWNGTNETKFNMRPVGTLTGSNFYGYGTEASLWGNWPGQWVPSNIGNIAFNQTGTGVSVSDTLKYFAMSVRLVRNRNYAGSVEIGGRQYPTTIIGNQQWITENLDFQFNGLTVGGSPSYSDPRANYFDNNERRYGLNSGTGDRFGLLYNWSAVQYITDHLADLVPSGWHIPTAAEWDTLINAVGGSSVAGRNLKSTSRWASEAYGGTGEYGFIALPGGVMNSSGQFQNDVNRGYYWTTTSDTSTTAKDIEFINNQNSLSTSTTLDKSSGCYIRLVKDVQ